MTGDVAVTGNVDTSGVFKVNSLQVVGSQQSNVANLLAADITTISGSGADTEINSNFGNIMATLNAALDVLRVHGLMA